MANLRTGVDVGSTGVRAVELAMGSDPQALVRAAQVALPSGTVQNGEVEDVDGVAEAIRELWHRGKFRSRQVTMGVGNQRVVVREVTVPALPPKELRQSLPFQIEELIPIPMEEAVLDYDVLEEIEQEDRKELRLLVVAAQRDMVDRLVQAALRAKLEPVGVDLVPFALVRSVGMSDGMGLEEAEAGGEAVVDVGADVTNICVHQRGVPRFVRILPSGGADLTSALSTSLGLTEEAAEAVKRGTPMEETTIPPEAGPLLEARTGTLVDEIRSSLDFYQAQTPGAQVSRVLLTGGGSKLPGLIDAVRARIRGEVRQGSAFGKVSVRLNMDETTMAEAEPLLAVAVGLALPEEASG